ncbi:acyl-CoA dehydrogenase family protein [Fredinandcohnia sp. 179-A 10B2 NHS]|uniref:acyl-CoA dehydrogenase family protein n=1 Tax=Fredinandcohnia sp. 179-A 10B2 NHS TaxID=3235176 RepID=UPI0039A11857
MISFKPSEDEQAFITVAREFAKDVIRTNAREFEKAGAITPGFLHSFHELGFTLLELPESWGGLEMQLISQVQILEALTHGDLDVVQAMPGMNEAPSLIRQIPNHKALLPIKACYQKGELPTIAFVHDIDLSVKSNSIGFVVNGITKPNKLASTADLLIIAAKDENGQDCIFVTTNLEENWSVSKGDYRLGLLTAGFARIEFENLVVSNENVLSKGDEAKKIINETIGRTRILEAAKEIGLMSAALSYATQYASERKAFGSVIAKFQGVSFTLAQMAIKKQVSRNLTLYAATAFDEHLSDRFTLSKNCLSSSHRSLQFVTDSAVQLLGGHGYVQEHPVEKWMRDAQAQVIYHDTERDLLQLSGDEIVEGSDSYRFV